MAADRGARLPSDVRPGPYRQGYRHRRDLAAAVRLSGGSRWITKRWWPTWTGSASPRRSASDAAGLGALHRAHQLRVPFENLSIHLAEPISLDEPDLIDKIVRRRRGGFCYELNGAFALLLEALGAQVSRVAARVYGEAGRLSPPFDHLALIVRPADGSGPWLADVGFGSHSDYPLLLDAREDQVDPAGRFRLADTYTGDAAAAGDIDVLKDGQPQYRLETRERSLADCVPTCWWQHDLAAVALHPQHDLLPADPGRPGFHQRPDAHPDHPGRDPDRAAARYRRRAARGVPGPLRHRADAGCRTTRQHSLTTDLRFPASRHRRAGAPGFRTRSWLRGRRTNGGRGHSL